MRVGIVGLGAIAPLHIRAILSCGQEFAAICDYSSAGKNYDSENCTVSVRNERE